MKTIVILFLGLALSAGPVFSQDPKPGGPLGSGSGQWPGSYNGNIYGTPSVLTLVVENASLTGKIDAGGYLYNLSGQVDGQGAGGKISDPNTGGEMQFSARLKGGRIDLDLIVTDQYGQENRVGLVFNRESTEAAGSPQKAAADGSEAAVQLDQRLIGGWRHTDTYVSGDFGAVSEWYMQLFANGTYRYGDGQMMGGDSNTSFDSGQGSASTGRWKTEGDVVYINEGYGWQPYATYIVDSQSMLFKFSDGSKQLWERYR